MKPNGYPLELVVEVVSEFGRSLLFFLKTEGFEDLLVGVSV